MEKKFEEYLKIVQDPHVFIYLKSKLETSKKRIQIRKRELDENVDDDFLELVARMYERFFKDLNSVISRAKLLMVETDELTPEQVHKIVLEYIEALEWKEVTEISEKTPQVLSQ